MAWRTSVFICDLDTFPSTTEDAVCTSLVKRATPKGRVTVVVSPVWNISVNRSTILRVDGEYD
jgi:hypothetical protein